MSGASASSAGRGVNEIFDSMEYGPAKEDGGAAQAWLERHARSFGHFIDARWVKPEGRESYPSKNPATGQSLACTVQGCSSDVSLAVKSSREAFVSWSALPCHARARHLYSLTRTVQKHQSLFSVLESLDHGKPVQDCRNFDVPNVIRHLYYHAGWAERRDSEMKGWRPLGVVAAIVSSESPLVTLSWKVCPALAMGNTVVLKPDTRTRLSALLFAEICAEAGLPPGVVNVVTGDEDFGAELAQHPDVDKVDFTGSAERGRALCRGCAGSGKALSLRLGARSPCIVFDSADLDSAVEGIVDAAWSSAGQLCSPGSVLLVQESVWEPVLSRLRVRMSRLRCGPGLEKSVDLAPLLDESQRSSMRALLEEAKREGAEVFQVCGPSLAKDGPFAPPTLLTGLAPASRIFREEISAPVLTALPFRTSKEAIALANNSRYGLGAAVWTESLALALEVAGSLQVGSVWINSHNLVDAAAGFGGVKESGFGRDGGREGLFEYLRPAWSSRPRPSTSDLDYMSFGTSCETPPLPQGAGGVGREGEETPKVDRSYKLYIGGSQVRPDSGYSRPVLTAGGVLLAYVPDGNRKDIRNAVESANKIQPGWFTKGPHARAQILYFIAENLELRGAEFAQGLSLQSAVSLEEAQKEVGLSVARLFHWAALCDKYGGSIQETPFRGSTLCFREPIGVVGVVCPDEKPLLSFVTLMGAAICRGNAVVIVPSPSNPLPALAMCQVLETSDLPGGVVNIVSGERDQLTRHLTGHSGVQSVWYFGSEQGSQFVEWSSSDTLKRTWVNYGQLRDWSSPEEGAGEEFLLHATQCKNVWMPAGEIYAN